MYKKVRIDEVYPSYFDLSVRSFCDYIENKGFSFEEYSEAVYRSVQVSEAMKNLKEGIYGIKSRKRNFVEIKGTRDEKLKNHQKIEHMVLEYLVRKRNRGVVAWQYPIPSSKRKPKAEIIVPDIMEFKKGWKPDNYKKIKKRWRFEIPEKIYEVKNTFTKKSIKGKNFPEFDTNIFLVLPLTSAEKYLDKKYYLKGIPNFHLWGVDLNYYNDFLENPKNVKKWIEKYF